MPLQAIVYPSEGSQIEKEKMSGWKRKTDPKPDSDKVLSTLHVTVLYFDRYLRSGLFGNNLL